MCNDLELFYDEEIDRLVLEIEKMALEIEEDENLYQQHCINMELLGELMDLINNINTKLKLLKNLHHENIKAQYLIDLFLSQAISLYEGFIHNFLMIIHKYSSVIDRLDGLETIYKYQILFKNSKRDKVNDVDEAIGLLLDRTLNKPLFIKKIFETIFHFNLDESSLFNEDSEFVMKMDKALVIRNAHTHKNGIYTEDVYNLEAVNQLINNLIQFMDTLVAQLLKKQEKKML